MEDIRVFISYSHKDSRYLKELLNWLSPFQVQSNIEIWYDEIVSSGDQLFERINDKLKDSNLILLLLSQDYLSSKACLEEMSYAIDNCETKRVIPIILRDCTWMDTKCKNLMALPKDGKPIARWGKKDEAWSSVYKGINEYVIGIRNNLAVNSEFNKELLSVEFVKQNRTKVELEEIFVFPFLTKSLDAFTKDVLGPDYFLQRKEKEIIVKGADFSGKTSLMRWLFISLHGSYSPVFLDGNEIVKTKNFDDQIRRAFQKEYIGDFNEWFTKDNKVAIVDDYHHSISNNFIDYLNNNFVMIILTMNEDEYLIYFKDDPDLAKFSVINIGQFPLTKQEELISKWANLGTDQSQNSDVGELEIDKLEENVNSIITRNRIVPRYPFYILTILQSLEVFMPRDYRITAYGHCYQALITAQLLKKGIKTDQVDSCFNYLRELSFNIYQVFLENKVYTGSHYLNFKAGYKEKYYVTDALISRLENEDYPILSIRNDRVAFELEYIYYFFLGLYIAILSSRDILNSLIENIHLKRNALIIIFTIHHAQSTELLETILLHCMCIFDKVPPAELNSSETQFMNELLARLPESIISDRPVSENRRRRREQEDKIMENSLEKETEEKEIGEVEINSIEINKSMRIMEVLGQILKNRSGSFEKPIVHETLEHTINLGLRLLNIFLGSLSSSEFKEWLSRRLGEAEKDSIDIHNRELSHGKKLDFVEKAIQVLGYMVTVGMLNQIYSCINSEKLIEPISILAETKRTPAYEMLDFMVQMNQNGIDVKALEGMVASLDKNKNYWTKKTLSFYVQDYINTHRIDQSDRQKIYHLFKLKYLPNKANTL